MTCYPLRVGLLSAALLLTSALAAPAFANLMPELSPRQIASDVKIQYHPQTGVREFIAPSFDPFEDDRELAGSAQLRSASQTTTIDGHMVNSGAILDLSFYYNSNSADPYDNRGYEEAVFLSGDFALVTQRDNRVLECSENINDVVYYHEDYYAPSFGLSLYRPYRHYSGFNAYGHHGYGGFGGYYGADRYYGNARGYGYSHRTRERRGMRGRTRMDRRDHETRRDEGRRNRHNDAQNDAQSERNNNAENTDRTRPRAETRRDGTVRRRGSSANRRDHNYRRRGGSGSEGSRTPFPDNSPLRTRHEVLPSYPSIGTNRDVPRASRSNGRDRARSIPQTATPRITAPTPSVSPPRASIPSAPAARSTPRSERGRSARSERRQERARNTANTARESVRSSSRNNASRGRKTSRSSGRRGVKMMGLFPMASLFGRKSRSVDTQCAREERLSLHIPQDRLNAARFDGITILVLDRSGHELPIFIPPNYIEGFRQAATGQTPGRESHAPTDTIPPNTGGYIAPPPLYQTPQIADCPTGTQLQSDGTCLTSDYTGYPTQ